MRRCMNAVYLEWTSYDIWRQEAQKKEHLMEMKKTRRSLLAMLAAAAVFAGCTSNSELPTPSQMASAAKAVGAAAGMVANASKIEASQRDVVREIIAEAQKCVPATNQTFAQAWTPIAAEKTAKLVTDKKLTDAQAVLVQSAFAVAVDGVDYIFNVRYPDAKTRLDLLNSAATGFCEGFLSTFKASSTPVAASPDAAKPGYDVGAYDWLVAKQKAKQTAIPAKK